MTTAGAGSAAPCSFRQCCGVMVGVCMSDLFAGATAAPWGIWSASSSPALCVYVYAWAVEGVGFGGMWYAQGVRAQEVNKKHPTHTSPLFGCRLHRLPCIHAGSTGFLRELKVMWLSHTAAGLVFMAAGMAVAAVRYWAGRAAASSNKGGGEGWHGPYLLRSVTYLCLMPALPLSHPLAQVPARPFLQQPCCMGEGRVHAASAVWCMCCLQRSKHALVIASWLTPPGLRALPAAAANTLSCPVLQHTGPGVAIGWVEATREGGLGAPEQCSFSARCWHRPADGTGPSARPGTLRM